MVEGGAIPLDADDGERGRGEDANLLATDVGERGHGGTKGRQSFWLPILLATDDGEHGYGEDAVLLASDVVNVDTTVEGMAILPATDAGDCGNCGTEEGKPSGR